MRISQDQRLEEGPSNDSKHSIVLHLGPSCWEPVIGTTYPVHCLPSVADSLGQESKGEFSVSL